MFKKLISVISNCTKDFFTLYFTISLVLSRSILEHKRNVLVTISGIFFGRIHSLPVSLRWIAGWVIDVELQNYA